MQVFLRVQPIRSGYPCHKRVLTSPTLAARLAQLAADKSPPPVNISAPQEAARESLFSVRSLEHSGKPFPASHKLQSAPYNPLPENLAAAKRNQSQDTYRHSLAQNNLEAALLHSSAPLRYLRETVQRNTRYCNQIYRRHQSIPESDRPDKRRAAAHA